MTENKENTLHKGTKSCSPAPLVLSLLAQFPRENRSVQAYLSDCSQLRHSEDTGIVQPNLTETELVSKAIKFFLGLRKSWMHKEKRKVTVTVLICFYNSCWGRRGR